MINIPCPKCGNQIGVVDADCTSCSWSPLPSRTEEALPKEKDLLSAARQFHQRGLHLAWSILGIVTFASMGFFLPLELPHACKRLLAVAFDLNLLFFCVAVFRLSIFRCPYCGETFTNPNWPSSKCKHCGLDLTTKRHIVREKQDEQECSESNEKSPWPRRPQENPKS